MKLYLKIRVTYRDCLTSTVSSTRLPSCSSNIEKLATENYFSAGNLLEIIFPRRARNSNRNFSSPFASYTSCRNIFS